jgi:hypothetical protein
MWNTTLCVADYHFGWITLPPSIAYDEVIINKQWGWKHEQVARKTGSHGRALGEYDG